jgi:putative endonuclease
MTNSRNYNYKKKIKNYKFGKIAEISACFFLIIKGYKILKRNYKNHYGEIDIIAKKGKIFAAIEVKARKSAVSFDEIVTRKQVNRITNSFQIFLNKVKEDNFSARIDLIVIFPWKMPNHLKGFLLE